MANLHGDLKQYDSSVLPPGFSSIRSLNSSHHSHCYAEFDIPIVQSELDKREYKIIRLDNGMEICLVSDPDADQVSRQFHSISSPEDVI